MKNFVFVLALLSSIPTFAGEGDLTQIEKGTCMSFPKFVAVDKLVEGVHFENKSYRDDDSCDYQGYNCEYREYQVLNYKFKSITDYEHYTRQGKLVTTSQVTISSEISEVVSGGFDETYKKIRKEITKKIYSSDDTVCKNSFYQD